jgi:hypothetical protein
MVLTAAAREVLRLVLHGRFGCLRGRRLMRRPGVAFGVCRSSLIPRTPAIAGCERALTIAAPAAAAPATPAATTTALASLATLTALRTHGVRLIGAFGPRAARLIARCKSGRASGRFGLGALPRPLGRPTSRTVARRIAIASAVAITITITIGTAISATVTRAGAVAVAAIGVAATAVAAASVVLPWGPVASLAPGRGCGCAGCGWRCDRLRGRRLRREPASQAMQ